MPVNANYKCQTCRYWVRQEEKGSSGWCQRFPPQVVSVMLSVDVEENTGERGEIMSVWPTTEADETCGEYE